MAASDTQSVPLFQVMSTDSVRGTGEPEQQQRFLNEVNYASYYANRIADCLGMRVLELGVVEDADSQTAFYVVPGRGGQAPIVNGFTTTTRRPLSTLVETLRSEHRP